MIEFNKDNKFMPHRLILSLILVYEIKKMFGWWGTGKLHRAALIEKYFLFYPLISA